MKASVPSGLDTSEQRRIADFGGASQRRPGSRQSSKQPPTHEIANIHVADALEPGASLPKLAEALLDLGRISENSAFDCAVVDIEAALSE